MGKCYYIRKAGCPDGYPYGCTFQQAQTVCSSIFGSDTGGIVFEPTTLAINNDVLQTADSLYTYNNYWIGVNNGNQTYYSNGNPVSESMPWSNGQIESGKDCVRANSYSKDWYSWTCDESVIGPGDTMSVICEAK